MSKGPKSPPPDPELIAAKAKAKAQAELDIKNEKKRSADEEGARRKGLRGARSLLSGGFVGFKFSGDDDNNSNLGS